MKKQIMQLAPDSLLQYLKSITHALSRSRSAHLSTAHSSLFILKMAKKTAGRYRSLSLQGATQKYIDHGGLKKKQKISYPLAANGMNASGAVGRNVNQGEASYPVAPSSSSASISAGPSGIKPALGQLPSSSSAGGTNGTRGVEKSSIFSSISSTGSVEMPMPMPMSIDSHAVLSSSSSAEIYPQPTREIEEIEIRDDHICGYIASATEDPDSIRMPSWDERTTVYFSVTKPAIPHEVFIKRLVRRAKVSRRAFVCALMYLEKMRVLDEKLTLSPFNIHRLLVTALVIAGRHVDQKCYLKNLQEVVTVSEMDKLELVMLSLLQYNLVISQDDYERFVKNLTNT